MGWRLPKTLPTEFLPETMLEGSDMWSEKEEREMRARIYTLPELHPILVEANIRWRYLNFGYQFKFRGPYRLGWWPRTGSLAWQGHAKGEDYFLPKDRGVVARVKAFLLIPTAGELYPDEFPGKKRSTRRKPSKSEMLRRVEETRNERRRDHPDRSGGVRADRSVPVLPKDQVRVPDSSQGTRSSESDRRVRCTESGEPETPNGPSTEQD